jgi:hypothetical protein
VLGLRRRSGKTHARLIREELGESLDHFVQAANHAAGGVGATVGPRMHAARDRVTPAAGKAAGRVKVAAASGVGATAAALAPLAVAARNGGRRAIGRKPVKPARRWPRIATMLAAGAAVGAASALIMRRRRQQQWEEYDPGRPVESTTGTDSLAAHRAPGSITTEELAGRASSGIETIDTSTSRTGLGGTSPSSGIATPVPGAHSGNSRG